MELASQDGSQDVDASRSSQAAGPSAKANGKTPQEAVEPAEKAEKKHVKIGARDQGLT